ncbi:MAG TPA: hypothetical protein DIC42_05495 [Holosporales bacterium]|nr:hypothetical protein [Holosporales bacterium]
MKKKLLLGTALAVFSLQTVFAAALTLPAVNYRAAEVAIPYGATNHDAHGIGLQPARMLADTMPVGTMTYEQIRNCFMGNNDFMGTPLNNGFISTMPLANDDYTSPYDEPGQTHGIPYERNARGLRATKAEQLDAFRTRLHRVWRSASHYQEFSILITKLYNVANTHRVAQNINRTAFDKEFILTLFTSSTIAYVGGADLIPRESCGQGAIERITMELSTYRYLEHFPQATKEMSDALKSIIGFFNGQGMSSLIQGNTWVDYCDNFGPVQLARTRQQKLDALMTQCMNGFFKIISANNANMDAYARRYPQRAIDFSNYNPRTRQFPLVRGAPERITFEASIRSALKQYAEDLVMIDYDAWLDFAESEIAAGHRQGAKFRTAAPQAVAPQAVAPQINMARYAVPNIAFTLEEIINSGDGSFMYQGCAIQPEGWNDLMNQTLRAVLEAAGGIPDAFNNLQFSATSCSGEYVIFTIDDPFFHATELLVRHEDIPGRVASFTQPARQQHAAAAAAAPLDAAARALRAMGGIQPEAVVQPVVLPAAEALFPAVSYQTVILNMEFEDDLNGCAVGDRYIGNSPFSGILTGLSAGDAQLIGRLAAEPMENGAVISCNALLRDHPRLRQLEITYPGLGEALRSDFARDRSIAFFRFNAATMNAALGRRALASDHYVFTIGNVRTTAPAAQAIRVPQQPVVQPVHQYRPQQPIVQPAAQQPVHQYVPQQPVVQRPVVQQRTAEVINAEITNLSATLSAAPPAVKRQIGQQIQALRAELSRLA